MNTRSNPNRKLTSSTKKGRSRSRKPSTNKKREDKRIRVCEYCQDAKRYRSILMLKDHIEEHKNARRCPICDEAFNLNVPYFTMYRHLKRKHAGAARTRYILLKIQREGYMCCVCLDNFPTAVSLYTHQNEFHSDEKGEFECVCGETFKNKLMLRLHMNSCSS